MNEDELRTLIAQVLKVAPERVTREAHLVSDLAADSLSLAELTALIETHIGRQLPLDDLEEVQTVGDLHDRMIEAMSESPSG